MGAPVGNINGAKWTPENDEKLKLLYADDLSCSQIAGYFTGKTRNAIIGRVHRLKLPLRGGGRRVPSQEIRAAPWDDAGVSRRHIFETRPDPGFPSQSGRKRSFGAPRLNHIMLRSPTLKVVVGLTAMGRSRSAIMRGLVRLSTAADISS